MKSKSKKSKKIVVSIWDNKRFVVGFTMLMVFVILGFVVSNFSPYDPRSWGTVPEELPPSLKHPLGTTSLGRDVFWFLAEGIKNSLIIGLVAAIVGGAVGVTVGITAGFAGGVVDRILMAITDTFIAVPSLPILILLAFLFKGRASIMVLGLIISIFSWAWPARQVRAMTLSLRERDYISMAFFSGEKPYKILFFEIFPHVVPWTIANFINAILVAIGQEATLAVLGLSALEEATLGTGIYWAMQYQAIFRALWWWIASPVVAMIILFVSLFLTSKGLQEHLASRRS
ncbi:MAG: ABC transporter permease [Thermotogae bacterium]|nr:ABC transporter permease [Thermotogota bacterium]